MKYNSLSSRKREYPLYIHLQKPDYAIQDYAMTLTQCIFIL